MDPTAAPGGKEFFDEEVGNIHSILINQQARIRVTNFYI